MTPTTLSHASKTRSNILRVYEQATDTEHRQGSLWYPSARRQAELLAQTYGRPVTEAASIIAALSPGVTWQRNLANAEAVMEAVSRGRGPTSVSLSTYPANKKKAFKLAKGGEKWEWLSGCKVNSFRQCILFPLSTREVCVDGHAYSVWAGLRHKLKENEWNTPVPSVPSRIFRPKWYSHIANDYRLAADELGIRPCELQAVCWLTWRRIHEVRQRAGEEDLYMKEAA